jgi:type IV secretory pathway component VirB8
MIKNVGTVITIAVIICVKIISALNLKQIEHFPHTLSANVGILVEIGRNN